MFCCRAYYRHNAETPRSIFFEKSESIDPFTYAGRLKDIMKNLVAVPPCISKSHPIFVPQNLDKCTHVFVQNDARTGLEPVYNGPFKVLKRNEKFFTIEGNKTVSIDRTKPAFFESEILHTPLRNRPPDVTKQNVSEKEHESAHKLANSSIPPQRHIATRSGRPVNKPKRFCQVKFAPGTAARGEYL